MLLMLEVEIFFEKEGETELGALILKKEVEAPAAHLLWGLRIIMQSWCCFFIVFLVTEGIAL